MVAGMDTRPIAFFHRQRVVQVQGVPATRTVLEWLREHVRDTARSMSGRRLPATRSAS